MPRGFIFAYRAPFSKRRQRERPINNIRVKSFRTIRNIDDMKCFNYRARCEDANHTHERNTLRVSFTTADKKEKKTSEEGEASW